MTTYAQSGVHIELGNQASKLLYEAAKKTWQCRQGKLGEVIVPVDDFSGIKYIRADHLPNGTVWFANADGIGTKIEVAERMQRYETLAFDLIEMVVEDAVIRGGEPVAVVSILDVNTISELSSIKQIAQGYTKAGLAANVAIINGELAELGSRISGYGSFNVNWGAFCVWFANEQRLLTGKEVQPGDYLVGLRERGFRSNGLSLVRKILSDEHGDQWHTRIRNNGQLGEQVLAPSVSYCTAIVDMLGGYDLERIPRAEVHGIAHITGGGLPEKLGRMLRPSGHGAVIDNPFDPPSIMLYCQELGKVNDTAAYTTWNMGQGMVIATPHPKQAGDVAREYGLTAKVIGYVTYEQGIHITSAGMEGKTLFFT
ncbi:MAG: AIR synthase-related protein [archaeon]